MFLNRGETGRYIPKYGMIARPDPKKLFSYSSLIRITIFEIIAARPPVVMPDENIFFTASGNWDRISG